jgi:hypothetical protein
MPTRRDVLSCALFTLTACGAAGHLITADAAAPRSSLTAYRSEAEFVAALTRWRDAVQRPERRRADMAGNLQQAPAAEASLAAAPQSMAKSADSAAKSESITNVQTAGVDEGGIVKRAGDHLVILRRGRLFTVRIGGDTLEPTSMADAFAPGSSPQGAWYDELLISGSTVVVIGYSYQRGGTEIGLFDLSGDGRLAYRATYHLRSFDYYSSRNYASRLIGNKLVFYTPSYLNAYAARPWDQFPGVRRWRPEATAADFQRVLPATRIYRTDDDFDPNEQLALHTITTCELGGANLNCESTAVLGPAGRVFYVSQGSVYVWTSAWRRPVIKPGLFGGPTDDAGARSLSAVFRIPLDGSAPSAIKTAGVPIDQMSFLEDASGHLNVLLRDAGNGEAMWGSERTQGAMAMLRVPLASFGDGRGAAQREHYRSLPAVEGYALQNRFVGDWLLWGGVDAGFRQGEGFQARATAWALRYADRSSEPQPLRAGHQVERIEAMGDDALLVGNVGSDLHFTSVRLSRRGADVAGSHVQAGASQGETRSHGFFFRSTGSREGIVGLPVLEQGVRRHHGVYADAQSSASVLYLRQRDLAFTPLGRLDARSGSQRDDACVASCVDWYGNARPIFIGERVFALLGYELVEGQLSGGRWNGERIDERRRIDFSPRAGVRNGRFSPFNE